MTSETSAGPKSIRGPVTYADGTTEVRPGDRVVLRSFFRRRPGEIHYVPGVSEPIDELEHGGLCWVGLSLPDGWAEAVLVEPDTGRLKSTVRLIERGKLSERAEEDLERIGEESRRRDEAAEAAAAEGDDTPPGIVDWIALAFVMLVPAVLVTGALFAVLWTIRFLVRLF